jgi:hypothetical protein
MEKWLVDEKQIKALTENAFIHSTSSTQVPPMTRGRGAAVVRECEKNQDRFIGSTLLTMTGPLSSALVLLLLHILHPSSAFSNSPSHLVSNFQVSTSHPRFPQSFHTSSFVKTRYRLLSAEANDNDETPLETSDATTNSTTTSTDELVENNNTTETKGPFGKLKARLGGGTKFDKASLAKLGGSVLLSYGFVSNIFGITCVSCAWYIASKKVSLAPLFDAGREEANGLTFCCFSFTNNRRVYLRWHLDNGKDSWLYMLHSLPF